VVSRSPFNKVLEEGSISTSKGHVKKDAVGDIMSVSVSETRKPEAIRNIERRRHKRACKLHNDKKPLTP